MIKQAVILAAGRGGRLGPAGKTLPKGLMTIAGQQLVPRSIDALRALGIEQIIISTGHLASHYAAAFVGQTDVVCVPHEQYVKTGSMFTLYNVREYIRGDFLLLESDLLYEPRALTELLIHPADTTVLVSQLTGAGDECYVGVTLENQLVNISKRRAEVDQLGGELVGISKVSLPAFVAMTKVWEEQQQERPMMNYEDALVAAASRVPVAVHQVSDLTWCEVDTPEHRQRAETIIIPRLMAIRSQLERV